MSDFGGCAPVDTSPVTSSAELCEASMPLFGLAARVWAVQTASTRQSQPQGFASPGSSEASSTIHVPVNIGPGVASSPRSRSREYNMLAADRPEDRGIGASANLLLQVAHAPRDEVPYTGESSKIWGSQVPTALGA
eukprot:CAMPEP_0117662846 /NCGR_PEP_ID=MMETSP0804-20121206/8268_1 /TAXON_ID=1074897 /ORGANISM="Tetraselmis astigmatica, Strain CCMP880" /LENGTH=135 /DNA_ID=CAMNT_0005469767 /DNA_START=550 /DNA_END=955 /DNA_ORIENTATION=-